jgi:predicted nucleic acid-binding protein
MSRPSLFDTNILIDALNRRQQAYEALQRLGEGAITISRISWIEVMSGPSPEKLALTEAFLRGCTIIEVSPEIAARAAAVRRSSRLKLGDALIWATADASGRTLVTRDTRDFPADWPHVHHPYTLS